MKKLLIGIFMLGSFSMYGKDICKNNVTDGFVGSYYAVDLAQHCPKAITIKCENTTPSLTWKRHLTSHDLTSIWSYKKRTLMTARVARIEKNKLIFRVHRSKTVKNIDIPFILERNIEVFKLSKVNNELNIEVSGTDNHYAKNFDGICRYVKLSDDDAIEIRREEYLSLPIWQNERYQYQTWDEYINR